MHQVDRLVDSAEGGAVDRLSTDGTTGADTGGVFTSASISDSVDEDLDGVLAGEDVDEVEDLLDLTDSHLFLTVVAAARDHHGTDETFDEGALSLLELLGLVATSSVGNVHLLVDGGEVQVVSERVVRAGDTFVGPLAEELGLAGELKLLVIVV